MLGHQFNRFLLCTLLAACGLCSLVSQPSWAGECGCESVCTECSPNQCDCPCDCRPRLKCPKPFYKALDAVAGGIEKVLGLDKIHCGPGCDGGCDGVVYDDGCDSATQLEFSDPSLPPYLHQAQPIGPGAPAWQTPHVAPSPAEYPPYDQYQGEIQAPRMQMRMGPPSFNKPQPRQDPGSLAPPVHPQESLLNPFLDDARVNSKRQVHPISYDPSKGQPKRKALQSTTKHPQYSRSYSPSERMVRKVR